MPDLRTMRIIQRALSDVLNIFFHDYTDPERLWPWWELFIYAGVLVGIFVVLSKVN